MYPSRALSPLPFALPGFRGLRLLQPVRALVIALRARSPFRAREIGSRSAGRALRSPPCSPPLFSASRHSRVGAAPSLRRRACAVAPARKPLPPIAALRARVPARALAGCRWQGPRPTSEKSPSPSTWAQLLASGSLQWRLSTRGRGSWVPAQSPLAPVRSGSPLPPHPSRAPSSRCPPPPLLRALAGALSLRRRAGLGGAFLFLFYFSPFESVRLAVRALKLSNTLDL